MYKIEKWNKIDSINGVSAESLLKKDIYKSMIDTDVLLVKQGNRVTEIQEVDIIKNILGLPYNTTFEEVAEAYLKTLNNSTQIEELNKDELLEENRMLRESLKAILAGDMQTLAYNLYPEDFDNK